MATADLLKPTDADSWPAWTDEHRYAVTRPARLEALTSCQAPPDGHRDFLAWLEFEATRYRATGELPAILAAEALEVLAAEARAVATPGRPLNVAEFLDRQGALEAAARASTSPVGPRLAILQPKL